MSQTKAAFHKQWLVKRASRGRNARLYDLWSLLHIASGILLAWVMPVLAAFSIMALYEPVEVFILSPLLGRYNLDFGYEAPLNSLSDIFFDIVGLTLGYYVLAAHFAPPFRLF